MPAGRLDWSEYYARFKDKETIWSCPCGHSGNYRSVVSHRKGYKKRPECAGKIFQVSPDKNEQILDAEDDDQGQSPVEPASDTEQSEQPNPTHYGKQVETEAESDSPDWLSSIPADLDDPEEIARILNQQNGVTSDENGKVPGFDGLGNFGADFDLSGEKDTEGNEAFDPFDLRSASRIDAQLGDGDWKLTPPNGPTEVSEAKETVTLPVSVRMMYDWARGQGWNQGDGSISAFVTDIVLDHFQNCWGKAIVVVDRKEVLRA